MKTSELKKIVEDNGFYFVNESCNKIIFIYKNSEAHKDYGQSSFISKEYSWFSVDDSLPKVVAQAILDYAYTPLEEREDEKKYHLRFPKGYNRWYSYLAKEINKDNGEYDCSGKCIDNEKYKNIFTQEEIDAMPFDTSFFIKEEVND